MNWMEENTRDEKLLGRLDMELLSQDVVAHGDALAELVAQHNDRLVAMSERHAKLVDDRKRLVDFTVWANAKLDDVLAERTRVVRETWEWLQVLRDELAQRENVLAKAQNVLQAMLTDLATQREQTVARLNKAMARTRREHVAANPARGAGHFAELVESDDTVVAVDQEYAKRKADLEWAIDHRRRASHGQSMVMARQEEVFRHALGSLQ